MLLPAAPSGTNQPMAAGPRPRYRTPCVTGLVLRRGTAAGKGARKYAEYAGETSSQREAEDAEYLMVP